MIRLPIWKSSSGKMGGFSQAGELGNKETAVDGLDAAVGVFIGLFTGENVGKMVAKIS